MRYERKVITTGRLALATGGFALCFTACGLVLSPRVALVSMSGGILFAAWLLAIYRWVLAPLELKLGPHLGLTLVCCLVGVVGAIVGEDVGGVLGGGAMSRFDVAGLTFAGILVGAAVVGATVALVIFIPAVVLIGSPRQ